MKHWIQYFRGTNQRGSTAVEMGLTMLPFLLSMYGVMEFGWYFLHSHTLTAATRDGIRIGATGQTTPDGNGDMQDRETSVKQAIIQRASDVMEIDASEIFIFPLEDDFSNPNNTNGNPNAGAAGAFMRVRVQYTHEFFTDLIGGIFGNGGHIQMVTEGTYRNESFIAAGS